MSVRKLGIPPAIWGFVLFKSCGLLLNGAYLLLLVLLMAPAAAAAGDELFGVLIQEGTLPLVEIVATVGGIVLILRRHPQVRVFWIGYLALYSLIQLLELAVSPEGLDAFFFLVTGLAWLAYWATAEGPRRFASGSGWLRD